MDRITRRRFTRLILSGIGLSILASCSPAELLRGGDEREPGSSGTEIVPDGTSSDQAGLTPSPRPRVILQNEDHPGFYVRYYRPFEAVDPDRWTLSMEGLVRRPRQLTLSEVRALPLVSQVSRMKCVECWSAPARWEGFRLSALAQQVEPRTEARWIHFHCADGYYESLRVEELLAERVLFAHRMNDQPLPDRYGAPLRLIAPAKYGYKGAKAITRLVFAREELRGYWPERGYSSDGDIEPGWDRPLDLGDARQIDGGEIRYPDGPEAREA